ncbi:hypothetical protein ABB37_07014 [Leptomonas pyrrhocoris]|uniref:RING-type domain-containing protein n=1 Tax=Leptomonas pyrrhocoris TaxID=157538 RepID=A0A0N1J4K0_LEPPY|nr:hypothetical protein ABB37_07014 [Leptomonas pyrrhocoris]KPA77671.1 hypothetical protein ABB37_07014 [Leptomonas pyrrhocoris]|eukprot:XP_015656110.1 hypothetical protein ABB37_07014 [Leptomonas pyrrhocoris]
MPSLSIRSNQATGRRSPTLLTVALAALLLLCLVGAAQPALARLERQAYVSYRTPHLCSYQLMVAAKCGEDKPMCCVASSAIRCCASTASCGNCTEAVVGYEMPKSSVVLGCFSLSVLVLLGSIIMSGVGRHVAWVLERRRVIENYRKRLTLRRAEAREFKKELAETEVKDIEDSVACVICCARHIDVALTPCGHVCCCRFCAKRLKECPVCRATVQRCFDLPLYYVKQLVRAATEEREGGEEAAPASPAVTATSDASTAAASPITANPMRTATVDAEQTEEAAVAEARTRTGGRLAAAWRVHSRSNEVSVAVCRSHRSDAAQARQQNEDDLDDGAVGVAAAPLPPLSARVGPSRGRRYTLLFNDEDEDAAAVPEATTADAAAVAASPLRTAAAHETPPAAGRRGGYISVEREGGVADEPKQFLYSAPL